MLFKKAQKMQNMSFSRSKMNQNVIFLTCVCLTVGTIFLLIAFFMALRFLMGVMIISFALPNDLYKFRKWLVYKDFILKGTKLLV